MNRSKPIKALAIALATFFAALAVGDPASAQDPAIVEAPSGSLRGTVTEDGRSFQGIPYAAPPVGELRLRATEPVEPWDGVRDATAPGAMCPQVNPGSGEVLGSEDCLYLNVHTPLESTGPSPVIVYVPGGGFINGNGAAYDPARFVERSDAIVITVNYRIGALGFLAHPGLDDPYAGNFGLADQQQALRWVEQNIAAFGGDPGNVTLWGQSAGGFAVCAQLASPAAEGLFDKAIIQSASCANDVLTVEEAQERGVSLAEEIGCTDPDKAVECLRETDLDELVPLRTDRAGLVTRHHKDFPWFPVAGTEALPTQPLKALWTGKAADVPLIHGSTTDEMSFIVDRNYDRLDNPVTAEEYPDIIEDLFGRRDARRILAKYPLEDFDTPSLALSRLLTDYGGVLGTCSQLPSLYAASRHAPVYAYEFAEPVETEPGDLPLGAAHGADSKYFFDTVWNEPPSDDREVLANTMIDLWADFAATGEPGGGWGQYRYDNALSFTVDAIEPIRISRGHHCGFWIPRLY